MGKVGLTVRDDAERQFEVVSYLFSMARYHSPFKKQSAINTLHVAIYSAIKRRVELVLEIRLTRIIISLCFDIKYILNRSYNS